VADADHVEAAAAQIETEWGAIDLLDRVLGQRAVAGQQSDEPLPPDRPDNLWSPVAGDFGAHGRFDAQAHTRSTQMWLTMQRDALLPAAALLLAAGVLFTRLLKRKKVR
jgi:hypothetical protein